MLGNESLPPTDFPALVEALTAIDHPDVGYSANASGTAFLPYGERDVGMLLLEPEPRQPSHALTALVSGGAAAMPALISGLGDTRVIAGLPAMKAMMWMSYPDEYDWNRRATATPPQGVHRDNEPQQPTEYRVTVGDLCFIAIGQIVNRNFTAVRYQPSGGLVVNSPSRSLALLQTVVAEWGGLSVEEHRRRLTADFLTPDSPERRVGAAVRIAFYAPEALPALVIPYLATPTYDVFAVEAFVREHLYTAEPAVWKDLVNTTVAAQGEHWRIGILRQLFDDLDSQEATEEHRISSPFKHGDLPRHILVQAFGFPAKVRSTDLPISDSETTSDRARFIATLIHDQDTTITAAVEQILQTTDDDYLAQACFQRCVYVGDLGPVTAACERLIPSAKVWKPELEAVLSSIHQAQAEGHTMTLTMLPPMR